MLTFVMQLRKKHIEISFHVLFWLTHLTLRVTLGQYHPVGWLETLYIEVMELPIKMGASYAIIYVLVPTYLKKERYWQLALWTIIGVFITAFLKRVIDLTVIFPLYPESEFWSIKDVQPYSIVSALRRLIYIFPTVVAAVAIYFVYDWMHTFRKAQQLEKEKMAAELNYLKGQIHPHFLFNTLNNLYALTLKNSPDAPQVVMKLSQLLSYMLYEANGTTVLLSKEVTQIEHLIALEKLRYGNRLESSLVVQGNISGARIAPLILLPFVENAFKHGTSGTLKQSWVSTSIFAEQNAITFQIENSVAAINKDNTTNNKGIGLQNVKRRLALLYPEKHELRITKTDTFRVWLKIETTAIKTSTQNPVSLSQKINNHEVSDY